MEPRTFKAPSTQHALEQVQQELGTDAIILSVRQVPGGQAWQTWKRPEVEVMAVPMHPAGSLDPNANSELYSPKDRMDPNFQTVPRMPREYRSDVKTTKITNKKILETYLARFTTQIAQTKSGVKDLQGSKPDPNTIPENQMNRMSRKNKIPISVVNIKHYLEEQGLANELVKRILTVSSETLSPDALQDEKHLRIYLKHLLEAYIRVPKNNLVDPEPVGRIFCVIGPSGSGKTSVCAKLAAYYSKVHHKKVAWISADTIHTGAITLARSYTESLSVPLRLVYTPDELAIAVEAEADSDLIVVDTPARNPYRPQEVIDMGEYLTALPQRETYLVLQATAKEADLHEAVVAFNPFKINGLVITKIDETKYFGNIFNLAWRSQIPLCALTTGTNVLTHFHLAKTRDLIGLLFGEEPMK